MLSIPVGLARSGDDTNVRAENVPMSVGNADVPMMYHTDCVDDATENTCYTRAPCSKPRMPLTPLPPPPPPQW